ncbi:guanitoxin biosynthesis heme-dependent pre-guanitoxin N-hydroxylase GntA [Cyclobacterium jeungdonense]|uniref:Guanitoxin biosynthesis heme-dependent pre-guanitoxin N-hydroxylase GntA n=1 Tax=Cyclobacterium jeungdonense TaxID=708087 RepID=A0ABT8C8R3_9BACT|nr:guanitoxin biosynthesis heme-dependent pre-guanitoxin N-hydroxylase GntA [Cyclobacterium jeungdonense]MDN3688761.1 guanitoxin biosynthesis heme-dependent pre-guanitoxin N-hydroxylase GntA [Cyclobacterium jeungdonense]
MKTNNAHPTYWTPKDIGSCKNDRIKDIHKDLNEKIADPKYPCVGAKASINTDQYRMGIYEGMASEKTTQQLSIDLKKYTRETIDADSDYLTFIAYFTDEIDSELDFEQRLWDQLQKLHDFEGHKDNWDPSVSSNPEDDNFSFSFGGTAFFIVGLHPKASRLARRISYPAMAFNLHRQFDKLRENDQFENMKKVIRDRDLAYQGSINPMLEDFGEGQEAPQYSGRRVEKNWKCPFHNENIQPEKEKV